MLHIVNKSSYGNRALDECLRFCSNDSAILLIEDGVYAALANSESAAQLIAHCNNVYALIPDIAARGLTGRIADAIVAIDYADFVQLCCEHTTIQSWY
ncbi:MAG: sulfur relay protein DsrH [Verrucomicrobiaceae bacterium]|nr:sulfur relay protein DsrH [Verrucomicrobiaceae bacterium]